MASLNNYLKGNLLLHKGFHNASIETSVQDFKFCQKLFSYILQENINAKDRIVLIINFDIGKYKRFLYNTISEEEIKYQDRKIVQLQQKVYLIEYNFGFDLENAYEAEKNALYEIIDEFHQEVIKKSPQPLFLFIQGLDIAELYLKPHDIYYWLLKILEEFNVLKQAYFLVQNDITTLKMMEYLETVVNCRVLVHGFEQTQENVRGNIQMVLSKNSGSSYFEEYSVILKGDKKISCKIDKVTKEMIEAKKNEGKDIQKHFQTPFKIELTEAEKKLKEGMVLPHMKAQNPEVVWKDYLLEVENDEEDQIDPEQDEDEDLDV